MDNPRKVNVNISNRTMLRAIFWVTAAVLAYHFVGRISHILTLIFASFFLALALNPVVSWMSNRLRIDSRVRATAASYLLVVVILAAFVALIVPPLVRQTRDYINNIPQTVQTFQQQDSGIARTLQRYNFDQKITDGAKALTSHYGNFGTAVLDTGRRVGEAIASVVAVLVLTFMMLVEGPKWFELLVGTMPEKDRPRYKKLSMRMYKVVTGFVNGQVILAAVASAFAFIALQIASHVIGVSNINAVALAGIVLVFGIIPLFGNPIAALLVTLACLFNSVTLALIMLIYFFVYFFVENHTFQPFVQSRLNELTPMTVFIAALLGVGFGGIMGAIVAIPAAGVAKILLEDYFERRHNKKPAISSGV